MRVIDLHHAHAALGQSPRHEALLAEDIGHVFADAVKLLRLRRFPLEVERFGRFHLHAKSQLERFDARAEPVVLFALLLVQDVQPLQQVELAALLRG